MKIEYWTINKNGDISESRHSIQNIHSKRSLITTNTFNKLYKNCIIIGANTHNRKFRNASETSYTYNVLSYKIVYDTKNKIKTKYYKTTKNLKIKEGKNIKYVKQNKNKLEKASKYTIKLENKRIEQLQNSRQKQLTDKEYKQLKKYGRHIIKNKKSLIPQKTVKRGRPKFSTMRKRNRKISKRKRPASHYSRRKNIKRR